MFKEHAERFVREAEEIMKEHNLALDKALEIIKIVQTEKLVEELGNIRYLVQETRDSIRDIRPVLDSTKWEIGGKIDQLNQTFREPISQ